MYLDEDVALWAFHNSLVGFRTLHRDYFVSGFPRLTTATTMLKELVKVHYTKVYTHLY